MWFATDSPELIKEKLSSQRTDFDSNLDIVVVAKTCQGQRSYHEVESAFLHLAKHHITGNEHDKEISD